MFTANILFEVKLKNAPAHIERAKQQHKKSDAKS